MTTTCVILAAISNQLKKKMTFAQLMKHFGTQTAVAKKLGVSQPCVANWAKRGIPPLQQIKLNKVTDGALKVDKGIL